jgi:murein DD-endopeptidase MepM/ murein hydrolase activator NlpD
MDVPTQITSFDLQRTFTLDHAGKDQPLDRERLVKMAQEFEGMLLLQMVRQMRQSMLAEGEEEDDLGLGKATMTDTFDVEFANYLAKQGGIGLSKTIEQQFEKAEKSKADAAALKELGPQQPAAKPLEAAPKSIGLPTTPSFAAPSFAAPRQTVEPSSEQDQALVMPLESDASSAFGWRADPFRGRRKFHNGVDLRAAYGTEVPTAAPGKVTFAGERGGYGLLVVVEHPNGVETRYAHLSSAAVQPGDSVAAGQTIGRVGSSGRSTGPHLHFEVLLDGKRVNPEQFASDRATVQTLARNGQTLAP